VANRPPAHFHAPTSNLQALVSNLQAPGAVNHRLTQTAPGATGAGQRDRAIADLRAWVEAGNSDGLSAYPDKQRSDES
jgi:hypothetical protein